MTSPDTLVSQSYSCRCGNFGRTSAQATYDYHQMSVMEMLQP